MMPFTILPVSASLIPVLPACVRGQEDPACPEAESQPTLSGRTLPRPSTSSPQWSLQSMNTVLCPPTTVFTTHTCARHCSPPQTPVSSLTSLNGSRGGCQSLPQPRLCHLQLRVTGFCPTAPLTLPFAFVFNFLFYFGE